jgi:hypothetical protein
MSDSGRKSIRFEPDEGTIAQIDPTAQEDKSKFRPTIQALVIDEALDGCGVVLVKNTALGEGDICLIKVGQLDPLIGEVRWIKELDQDVHKIGIMYLE